MPRKIVSVTLTDETLKTHRLSSLVNHELCKLCYCDHLVYDKGAYILVGKAAIKEFCQNINQELDEILEMMRDPETVEDVAHDRKVLSSFLKVKAS
jgi:hypothetical protein